MNSQYSISQVENNSNGNEEDYYLGTSSEIMNEVNQYEVQNYLIGYLNDLKNKIKLLHNELKNQLYIQEINFSRLNKWVEETEYIRKYINNKQLPRMNMSLFVDNEGQTAPSTSEGIEKAIEKYHLPIHRKKYDWNLQIWNDQDCHKLWKLTVSKMEIDTVKLIVEGMLFNKTISQKDVVTKLLSVRAKIQLTENGTDNVIKRLQLLERQLKLKANRLYTIKFMMIQSNLNTVSNEYEYKDLVNIVLKNNSFNHEDPIEQWDSLVIDSYWKEFWDSIALMLGSRVEWSGRDCQIQWEHHMSPKLNLSTFKSEEDKFLKVLVKKYDWNNWEKVAEELGTNRTPYQCFERCQRKFNKYISRSEWSEYEDAILLKTIKELGDELTGPSCWSRVALRLPGRSNFQCRARYVHSLKENIKHGSWELEEDIILLLLVNCYGRGRWSKIANHISWRTDMKCRERYENVIFPLLAIEDILINTETLQIPTSTYVNEIVDKTNTSENDTQSFSNELLNFLSKVSLFIPEHVIYDMWYLLKYIKSIVNNSLTIHCTMDNILSTPKSGIYQLDFYTHYDSFYSDHSVTPNMNNTNIPSTEKCYDTNQIDTCSSLIDSQIEYKILRVIQISLNACVVTHPILFDTVNNIIQNYIENKIREWNINPEKLKNIHLTFQELKQVQVLLEFFNYALLLCK